MRKELVVNNDSIEYEIHSLSDSEIEISISGQKWKVKRLSQKGNHLYLQLNDKNKKVIITETTQEFFADINGFSYSLKPKQKKVNSKASEDENSMFTPMPGKVLKVLVDVGQEVSSGDSLVIMEAMKMEHTLVSNKDAVVEEVLYKEGDLVEEGVELIHLKDKNATK